MFPSRPVNTTLLERVVLAVSGNDEELEKFQRLFTGSNWKLQALGTMAEAEKWLDQNAVPVVLCAPQLPDGDWKDMLRVAAQMDPSPNLVVASRLADDRLWAEVLNLGGYDVLALPANATEIFLTLSGAWRNWKARSDVEAVGTFAGLSLRGPDSLGRGNAPIQ